MLLSERAQSFVEKYGDEAACVAWEYATLFSYRGELSWARLFSGLVRELLRETDLPCKYVGDRQDCIRALDAHTRSGSKYSDLYVKENKCTSQKANTPFIPVREG